MHPLTHFALSFVPARPIFWRHQPASRWQIRTPGRPIFRQTIREMVAPLQAAG